MPAVTPHTRAPHTRAPHARPSQPNAPHAGAPQGARSRRGVRAAVVGAVLVASVSLATTTASAATYQVSGSGAAGLAVHTAPNAGAPVTATYADGTSLDIACQTSGTTVNGVSWVWDQLAGGGYVADYYTTTPVIDNFTTSLPNCAGATSPLNPSAYPWPSIDPTTYVNDGYGYYEGECTSFAAWAVRNDGLHHVSSSSGLGNANAWYAGVTESSPHVGDVAQWDAGRSDADSTGHVAYVSEVYGDGTIQVEEYNWLSQTNGYTGHRYNTRRIPVGDPSRYLQF